MQVRVAYTAADRPDRRLALEDVNEAFALVKGGKVARTVLDIGAA